MLSYLNHTVLPANNMIVQLQQVWILLYIPNHYSLVHFRSLHYYIPGVIILTGK